MSPAATRLSPRERLDGVLPEIEIAALAPVIEEIDELKRSRNAVVLAHNYMTPDIYHGVSDMKGDSLALARLAKKTDAEVILICLLYTSDAADE